jgi:hypothetical protein
VYTIVCDSEPARTAVNIVHRLGVGEAVVVGNRWP